MPDRLLQEKARGARWIKHRIIKHPKAASHARAQARLGLSNPETVQHFNPHTAACIALLLSMHLKHFVFVGSQPERATLLVLNVGRKLLSQIMPQLSRIRRERELRLGVIHDDQMSHSGAS